MKTRRIIAVIALLLFCFITTVFVMYSPEKSYSTASGTLGYGSVSIGVNETKTVTVRLNNVNDVQAVGGTVEVEDESCVIITSVKGVSGTRVNNNTFALSAMDEIPSGTSIINVNVKGLKECSTRLKFVNAKVTSTDAINAQANISNGLISVKKPQETPQTQPTTKAPQQNNNNNTNTPKSNNTNNNNNNKKETTTTKSTTTRAGSNNNYLNTLSVDGFSLDFNKDKLEYSLEVEEDINSISLNASTEDSKATFRVDGTNDLSVGENTVKVIVEAENGSTRTYIIHVTRKGEVKGAEEIKPEPSTYLSSIVLNNGRLLNINGKEIKFDKNNTVYYYSKEDNFSYDFTKEYEEATTKVYETNDTITIIVSLSDDDYRVYTLVKYDKKNNNIVLIILLFIIGIVIGFILKCLIKRNK